MRKAFVIIVLLFLAALTTRAQQFPLLDKSPADIIYFPLKAPSSKDPEVKPIIKVIYSRPQKNGREIFGVLEQFGKVWRVGANESTEIKFFETVKLGDKKIKHGTYSLFAIPNSDKWIIIINKITDKWGAFTYDQSADVARIEVPVIKSSKTIEAFSITFIPTDSGAKMMMGWDNTIVEVPFVFSGKK
ncbi:DUF2911 domain-containing protein [Pedobacter sp. HMF7647]|uniref:DUF2911 domain-containing protein n=1 Tax=Hufsiella arboris TaxID=2695275 RepID=A0A7K1Y4W7_9SPHI|nr:DUF2911 domain-containing protein [Hufsiella arboris]MXV49627.1 DUF2911 domain-containing protein [Hufsiella arboris]